MPIPRGARGVPGQPNRVQLPSGDIVGRGRALTLGAQEQGYRNHKDYRLNRNADSDAKHWQAWKDGRQGRSAIAREKELAKREGRRYNPSNVKQRFLSARNTRPRRGAPAGEPWLDFVDRYDLDSDTWLAY